MWRWFRWILLAVIIFVVGIGIFLYCYYILWMRLGPSGIEKAETALATGITVQDAKDDFVMLGSNKEELNAEDNPSPYRVDYLDIKSVSLGADDQYLYYKMTFWGEIPKTVRKVNGDPIQGIVAKIELVDDQGKEYGGAQAGFGYTPVINLPVKNTYYFYGPTGIEWPESARYTGQASDSKISGGGGTDYILCALPLARFDIKNGDTINVRFPMEVKSIKYTHAAVDVLQGVGKAPGLISWKVGTGQYSINNSSEETDQNKENQK